MHYNFSKFIVKVAGVTLESPNIQATRLRAQDQEPHHPRRVASGGHRAHLEQHRHHQDTAYLHYGKQYLKDCYIERSLNFIFGNSTAVLEHCHILCKSAGFITTQSRKSSQESTGYVFLRCVITGNGGTPYASLGRPWGPFGRVVFAYTYMDACIKHAGWNNWGKTENERSACFYEYRCFGLGSCSSKRAAWAARELVDEEAEQFIMHSFIDPNPERQAGSENGPQSTIFCLKNHQF